MNRDCWGCRLFGLMNKGTLHNANDDFVWYGPDSFRTTGDDWTDSYRVRAAGILSAVMLQKKAEEP